MRDNPGLASRRFQGILPPVDYGNDWCKLAPKPIRWDHLQQENREKLFSTYQNLIYLKNNYPVFSTDDFDYSLNGFQKIIHLNTEENKVCVLGNFDVQTANVYPAFQQTGWWYEFFSGDSLFVSETHAPIELLPGAYRLYSTRKMENPWTKYSSR